MKNKREIKEYIWTCDFCGEEFKTKKESDKHELVCDKNPDSISFPLNRNIKKSWLVLWITTMIVFGITVLINSNLFPQGLNLFDKKWFLNLFFINIIIGIIAFLGMVFTENKNKKKISPIIKYSFVICLFYCLFNVGAVLSVKNTFQEQKQKSDYIKYQQKEISPVVKLQFENTDYNGQQFSGKIINKNDKPVFNIKIKLNIFDPSDQITPKEQHEFVFINKIEPEESINILEKFKTKLSKSSWSVVFLEAKYYNGEVLPTPTAIPTSKPVQILNNDNILKLINQYRQQNGLEPLTKSEELCRLAEQRASYLMADRMSAYRSSDIGNHSGFRSSVDGYSGNGIGENIGANIPPGFKDNPNDDYSGYTKQYKTNQDAGAVSQWVHSPPHNALLLTNEKDGVKLTKGCVAHRIEDYAMLTVLLVGDK